MPGFGRRSSRLDLLLRIKIRKSRQTSPIFDIVSQRARVTAWEGDEPINTVSEHQV